MKNKIAASADVIEWRALSCPVSRVSGCDGSFGALRFDGDGAEGCKGKTVPRHLPGMQMLFENRTRCVHKGLGYCQDTDAMKRRSSCLQIGWNALIPPSNAMTEGLEKPGSQVCVFRAQLHIRRNIKADDKTRPYRQTDYNTCILISCDARCRR